MDAKKQFQQVYPNAFFLEKDVPSVEQYLRQQGWLLAKEKVKILEKPGAGNMNFVLRVITSWNRSFILKQARPWVEKFPQFAAPVERVAVEATFFQLLQELPVMQNFSPTFLDYDANSFILATEDLGQGADYGFLYERVKKLSDAEGEDLIQYLSVLHALPAPVNFPVNKAMRLLNQEHIFNFPFLEDNGFNLDEVQVGLQEAAMPYKKDKALKEEIANCGAIYLQEGNHLLHGDFYPGSWLKVGEGLKVIDPEFGFVGPAEFDLGVLLAHLMMAQQEEVLIESIFAKYQQPANFNKTLLVRFAGIEILRRLIGIAQLPLSLSLVEKKALLEKAADWIKTGSLGVVVFS